MNGIIVDVRWPVKVLRKTFCHSHSFQNEGRKHALPGKIRMNRREVAVRDVEGMFNLEHGCLFPCGVTCKPAISLGDKRPICPALEGRTHPLIITSRPTPGRRLGAA